MGGKSSYGNIFKFNNYVVDEFDGGFRHRLKREDAVVN